MEGDEKSADNGSNLAAVQQGFHHFSVNVESCQETSSKHICKRVTNQAGVKKTTTTTSQCCHGYKRSRGGFCEKFELLTMTQIADELNAKQFVATAEKNDLQEMMESNVTIFMPADESFKDFSQNFADNDLGVTPLQRDVRQNSEGENFEMKDILLNHMVKGFIDIEDIDNEQILNTEFENYTIRMNVFPKIRSNREEDDSNSYRYLYTANCVPIVKANKIGKNGIVHKIQNVLTPVKQNLMDIIRSREDMTILRTVLEKTKMDKMLEGVADDDEDDSTKKPAITQFTVFAPTDSAFEKLDPQLKRKIKEGAACAESESHCLH